MAFVKHTGLPGSPVIEVPAATATLLTTLGWASDPGPKTTPTFAPNPLHATTVVVKHASLPGRTITVPYLAFYGYTGIGGLQTLGWVLGP